MHGGKKKLCRILVGKPEGHRPLGRPRCRLDDNIKMELKYIRWGVVGWIHVTPDCYKWRALVNTVMNLWVPYKYWKFTEYLSDWRVLKKVFTSWS
jgi:hypothetical protein